jgi:hypothetical protein
MNGPAEGHWLSAVFVWLLPLEPLTGSLTEDLATHLVCFHGDVERVETGEAV